MPDFLNVMLFPSMSKPSGVLSVISMVLYRLDDDTVYFPPYTRLPEKVMSGSMRNAGRLSVPVGRYHFSLKSHKGIFVAYHDCIERLVALVLSPHAEFAVASVRSKLSERTE